MTAEQHLTYWDSLVGNRQTWDARWQQILEWVTPHKAYVTQQTGPGIPPVSLANRSRIHDTTAIDSCNTLADSHMSSLVPLGSVWFKWGAPKHLEDQDEIKRWYADCSTKALEVLSESNFYTAIYSLFRDRSGPGTGAMYLMKGKDKLITLTYMPLGTYAVAENEDGVIDTLYREFELTSKEAIDKFGEDKVGDTIRDCYAEAMKGDVTSMSKKFKFVHGVKPRDKRDPKMIDALNMKFESVYILHCDKYLVEEGGFDTFPFVVSRFEKWGCEPYGFSPAYNAIPNIYTANYLVKLMKAIGELKAMPRVLQLAGEKGQIDLRAGGRTVVSEKAAAAQLPREWGSAGDFELGQWLIESERAIIRKFFFTDLFKMFSNLPADVLKDMTATVAQSLRSENLLLLAPSFTQFTTDFRPFMDRLFAILYEAKVFDPPPQSLLDATLEEDGKMSAIPEPTVAYISRVGLALQELEDQAADGVVAAAGQAASIYPDILDNFNLDKWIRNKAITQGTNNDLTREWDEVEKIRAERNQQRAEQAAMMQAQEAAKAVKDASAAKPEVLSQLAGAA